MHHPAPPLPLEDAALVSLGRWLRSQEYAFTTPTPATHHRVNVRRENGLARDLRGIFGWSRPFEPTVLPPVALHLLEKAGQLQPEPAGNLSSRVRFSTLSGLLVAHSAFPTNDVASVFLGPDTSRFVALVKRVISRGTRVVEIGSGTGVAGLALADRVQNVTLTDISERAVRFSRINAEIAGLPRVEVLHSDVLSGVQGAFDLVIANPPYLVDDGGRAYRNGGGELGTGLAIRIVEEAMDQLAEGGTLVLYSGAPIVNGEDILFRGIKAVLDQRAATHHYEELDPDVFGEELERPAYRSVERLAAIALVATRASR